MEREICTKYLPEIGDVIRIPSRGNLCEMLRKGDDFVDSGFPGCAFRLPPSRCVPIGDAVNVEITGKTLVKYNDAHWLRCQVEFIRDSEESVWCSGFILFK